jgi:flagellar basal-body rod protein FlgB
MMDILDHAVQRLGFLGQRQTVLARNVANIDTPGFQGRDLRDFNADLGRLVLAAPQTASPAPAGWIPLAGSNGTALTQPYTVSMDRELVKVADVQSQQQFATNVYTKYIGLLRTALGRSS